MARGKQFTQLIAGVKAELRRNNDPGVRASDLSAIQQAVQRAYEDLYDEYDWPHLRAIFDAVPLSAGQRFYDYPDELDFDRIEQVRVWFNEQPFRVERGIDLDDYATYNSEADTPARADPVLKWDVRDVDDATQLEVWPIPSSDDQTIQFIGIKKFAQLVDDADLCRLDDKLVILRAALVLETNEAGVREKTAAYQGRLVRLKGRGKTNTPIVRMGLGTADEPLPTKTMVVIAGA